MNSEPKKLPEEPYVIRIKEHELKTRELKEEGFGLDK